MPNYILSINNKDYSFTADASTPLLWVLRDHLGLNGTKYGCGKGLCGACTVHLNGKAVRSCSLPVSAIGSATKITTIEGIGASKLHPLQEAWIKEQVPQCGYCQSGQIMSAVALLNRDSSPNERAIEIAMAGNICRCGTYPRIKRAIQATISQINKK